MKVKSLLMKIMDSNRELFELLGFTVYTTTKKLMSFSVQVTLINADDDVQR